MTYNSIGQKHNGHRALFASGLATRVSRALPSCSSHRYPVMRQPCSIRYLSMNDLHRGARDTWLQDAFTNVEYHTFADLETGFLSVAERDYAVLIIGGNDPVRTARFLKANRPILELKAKIALMHRSHAIKRAKVLNAGFDDVFDSARMSPEEAQARSAAIIARYRASADVVRSEQELTDVLGRVAHVHLLGKRERQLLVLLTARIGEPVTYYRLRTSLGRDSEEISYNYLKVLASNVRAKLKPPYVILPSDHNAYRIVRMKD